jgi:alkylhydroperoxidase family enzyme
MPFIETIAPQHAKHETAAVYQYMGQVGSGVSEATDAKLPARIAQLVQLFSIKSASMRRMIRLWELAMWTGTEPRDKRELIAAVVSRLNNCGY